MRVWQAKHLVVAALCFGLSSAAADTPPVPTTTPTTQAVPARVRLAKDHFDQSIRQANAAYLKAAISAKKNYLRELKAALSEATQAGNFDEAMAINAAKTQLEADIAAVNDKPAPPIPQTDKADRIIVKVQADHEWQTAIKVKKGEVIEVKAVGTWCVCISRRETSTCDADGLPEKNPGWSKLPEINNGALIGRIGSKTFLVGKAARITAAEDGDLEFHANDTFVGHNDGELTVTILRAK